MTTAQMCGDGAEARLLGLAGDNEDPQQFPELLENERILEADLGRRQWGKKNKAKLGKHDDPVLGSGTRWSVARALDPHAERADVPSPRRRRRFATCGAHGTCGGAALVSRRCEVQR